MSSWHCVNFDVVRELQSSAPENQAHGGLPGPPSERGSGHRYVWETVSTLQRPD